MWYWKRKKSLIVTPGDRSSDLYAWLFSLLFHLVILLVSFPYIAKKIPRQEYYRVPVNMTWVSEPVEEPKKLKPRAKSKRLVSRKPQAKRVNEAPKRLPGDRRKPLLTNRISPVYPKHALNEEWEGKVVVEVTIDDQGRPTHIIILQSSGHTVLDQSFVRTIRQYYTFKPKRTSGVDEEGTLRLSYRYQL